MGLDMYLYKRKGNNEDNEEEELYWRKANHFHAWFVKHVANGDDEKTADGVKVTVAQLRELRDTIMKVLKHKTEEKAKELLPTQSGFFFGGTEYDEYYWDDLSTTLNKLNKLLGKETDLDSMFEGYSFVYMASW